VEGVAPIKPGNWNERFKTDISAVRADLEAITSAFPGTPQYDLAIKTFREDEAKLYGAVDEFLPSDLGLARRLGNAINAGAEEQVKSRAVPRNLVKVFTLGVDDAVNRRRLNTVRPANNAKRAEENVGHDVERATEILTAQDRHQGFGILTSFSNINIGYNAPHWEYASS
jgi:hypothetical protein